MVIGNERRRIGLDRSGAVNGGVKMEVAGVKKE